jgi:UDP-glucose 4-epimerase
MQNEFEGAKVLITGGLGFVGSSLARRLAGLGADLNPVPDLEINCRAQLSILEACRAYNPKIRIIFANTRQIYGRPTCLQSRFATPSSPF